MANDNKKKVYQHFKNTYVYKKSWITHWEYFPSPNTFRNRYSRQRNEKNLQVVRLKIFAPIFWPNFSRQGRENVGNDGKRITDKDLPFICGFLLVFFALFSYFFPQRTFVLWFSTMRFGKGIVEPTTQLWRGIRGHVKHQFIKTYEAFLR